MDVLVADVLRDLGGVARRSSLLKLIDRKDLDRAVVSGEIVRDARGLYSLPDADDGLRLASKYGGVLALTSAALRHGWAVKTVPEKAHIMVSRGRKLRGQAPDVNIHFAELASADVRDQVTTEPVTLSHCLRRLPFADALAVADSALREGFGRQSLRNLTDPMRGPGSRQAQRVAVLASPRVANPFESSLHAITDGVAGLNVRPQVRIDDGAFVVRPDFVDEPLRLVLEADSFEWHGKRSGLASDTRRYNMLVVAGWIVLRFCYEDVMFHPRRCERCWSKQWRSPNY